MQDGLGQVRSRSVPYTRVSCRVPVKWSQLKRSVWPIENGGSIAHEVDVAFHEELNDLAKL